MHSATPQPKRLGKYEVTGTLAVGRAWRVYRGSDPASGQGVALKVIPPSLLERCRQVDLVQNDVRAAASLKHPGIVAIYESGEDAGLFFVAMEYVEGWYLKERFRVPLPDAVNLTGQLLEALDYAHDHGVLHRDIKPSNLLLTGSGDLRITNFGLPSLEADTPSYASPEIVNGLPVDRRADVFSAGAVFYELLTGVYPFPAGSGAGAGPARPASEVNPSIPPVFDQVCAKALARTANDRYPSARAFLDAVDRAFQPGYGTPLTRVLSHESVVAFMSAPLKEAVTPRREPPADWLVNPESRNMARSAFEVPKAQGSSLAGRSSGLAGKFDRKSDPAEIQAALGASPDAAVPGKPAATLASYLKDNPAPLEKVGHAFVASAKALQEAYAVRGKNEALIPQNICFDWQGKATIRSSPGGAVQGTIVLSNPRYAAPEMFAEKTSGADSANLAVNVYALGIMFYEILLGRTLFGKTFANQRADLDWLRWHADLEGKAPPVKSLLPDCPLALSDLLEAMMEKRVEKRTIDLDEIISRLRSVQQRASKTVVLGPPPRVPPKTRTPARVTPAATPKEKSWKNLILFAIIILAMSACAVLLWQNPDLYHRVIIYLHHLFERA